MSMEIWEYYLNTILWANRQIIWKISWWIDGFGWNNASCDGLCILRCSMIQINPTFFRDKKDEESIRLKTNGGMDLFQMLVCIHSDQIYLWKISYTYSKNESAQTVIK